MPGRIAADFEETMKLLEPQLAGLDPDVTQSVRAFDETTPLVDGQGPRTLEVVDLPLLSRADSEGRTELVTMRLLGEGGMGKVELALQRSLRREVAIKSILDQSDGTDARALLQEALFTGLLEHPNIVPVHQLPLPAPELEARVAALREELDARDARLQELERLSDWRSGAGPRLAFFLGLLGFWVVLWLWANDWHLRYQGVLTPERLAANVGVALLVLCGMVFAARRQLMRSQVNARLVGGVLVAGGAIFLHRIANCLPATQTAELVSTEILLCGLASALGGVTLARWLWLQVPIWIAGVFAARIFPQYAGLCFVSASFLALGAGLWRLRSQSGSSADAAA